MTMEMTPRGEYAIDRYAPPDVFADADPADLIVPRRSLVQGTSRNTDTKRSGEFYDALSKEYKAELRVAVLAQQKKRALFGDNFDDPPLCRSEDAAYPVACVVVNISEKERTTGTTCAECWFSQWGSDPKGGDGQACKLSYDLLCYDLDENTPFMLRVSGTSIRPWREFVTDGKRAGLRASGMETVIGSREVTTARGKYSVLVFERGAPLEEDYALEMQRTAGVYQGARASDEVVQEEDPFA